MVSKTNLILVIILICAGVLRVISALSVDIGTDEMIYTVLPLNIISAQRLSTVEQAPLYFYLVDLGYKITGGLSLLSGRLPSILFGTLAGLAVFLVSKEIFNDKKAALLSAFLFAISGYALRYNQEMDMTAYFFVLLSFFFFLLVMKGQVKYLYASILFLSLAVLVKPIVLLFAPAYGLAWLGQGWKDRSGIIFEQDGTLNINRKALKMLGSCFILAIIIISPVLIYNYLLYKDKGFTDYYFSVLAGVGDQQIYAGQEAGAWGFAQLLNAGKFTLTKLFTLDPLLLLLGIGGLYFAWKKDKYRSAGLMLTALFLFLYIGGKMSGGTHFLWFPVVLSIFAGYGAVQIAGWFQEKKYGKLFLPILIIVAVISLMMVLQEIIPLKEKSIAIALHGYADKNIPDDAVVVLDPRIYRGIYAWAFPNLHYLEGTYFPEVANNLKKIPGDYVSRPIYYIECGPGTFCGWKPEDFERITPFAQQLSSFFHERTQKIGEIKATDVFYVYSGQMDLPGGVYEVIDRTHFFWYAPVGWKYPELAPDYYATRSTSDKILQSFGFFILYLGVGIALLSGGLIFFLLGRRSG